MQKENTDYYLTDAQYLDLLIRIRASLDTVKEIGGYDDTTPGDKYSECNIGLCNEAFTTKESAAFPKEFPRRKEMKYRRARHHCPLDMRSKPMESGCFYKCMFFQDRKNLDLTKAKTLYDKKIKDFQSKST